ncbi:MAG: hypothetical protein R2685_10785 [Candidatus Nitrosocosmicus sp.]|nr:hypothetical protein [Candidatus Nitrosocosmicus sp.]
MDFIDINDIKTEDHKRLDRKVICNVCSTMGEKYYIEKVMMKYNPETNIYRCTKCPNTISGKKIESILYFNNKEFMYEPEPERKEQKLIVRFAGLDENDEAPEVDLVDFSTTTPPQEQESAF